MVYVACRYATHGKIEILDRMNWSKMICLDAEIVLKAAPPAYAVHLRLLQALFFEEKIHEFSTPGRSQGKIRFT